MVNMHSINLIASSPQVRSGRPYIVGTSVTVADVAIAMIYHRQDPDGIADWYSLSLPQVYAALAYYYDHKSDIDEQVQSQIRKARELKEQRVGNKGSLLAL
jgi:uncharacterized protein (DUF433 family)